MISKHYCEEYTRGFLDGQKQMADEIAELSETLESSKSFRPVMNTRTEQRVFIANKVEEILKRKAPTPWDGPQGQRGSEAPKDLVSRDGAPGWWA